MTMTLETGTLVELDIQDLAYGGRGVGRLDGMAVFVPDTLTGEHVKARLTALHKRHADAELVEVCTPATPRITPACPLTGSCPGCAYQHVQYAEEVRIKGNQLEALLKRLGGLESVKLLPPIPAPRPLGYRNKITLHGGEHQALGYYGKDNQTILDVPACPLAVDSINAALATARADETFMQAITSGLPVTFRWTETDGTVCWAGQASPPSPLTEHTTVGEIQVPPKGFFQVNTDVQPILAERVTAIIRETAPDYLIDLYGGIGLFALCAASNGVPHVLGIERNPAAVRSARRNAKRLELAATFAEGDVKALFAKAMDGTAPTRTLIIADPPRNGLDPNLVKTFTAKRPAQLLYISCAPDTLARDLRRLTADGWTVEFSQAIDMFPRTAHFETLTLLKCPPPPKPA